MKLLVHTAGGISSCEAKESRPLSETLREAGIGLDLRCGGNGRCGRCRIELVRGDFVAAGRTVSLRGKETAAVNACTCFPAGAEGEIRIPAASLHRSDGAVEVNFSPVPDLSGGPGGLSVAVDIGTTTVAALLVEDGRIVASAGMPNRQFRFGDNVIDRIAACQSSPGAQRELHRAVVDETINPLLAQFGRREGSSRLRQSPATSAAISPPGWWRRASARPAERSCCWIWEPIARWYWRTGGKSGPPARRRDLLSKGRT